MTAEVVIMNKLGMSMAADSAITSGVDGIPKVYNSANKLFSLSKEHPVGVMVYGAASFMEIPWEVIISSYRDYLGSRHFEDLSHYFEDFLDFLQHDSRFKNPEVESIIVYRTFSDILKRMITEVEEQMEEEQEELEEENKVVQLLEKQVDKQLDRLEKEKSCLVIDFQSFKKKFHDTMKEANKEYMDFELTETLQYKLTHLAYEGVRKEYFSVGSTGFVMAGYGEAEIFPHMLNYRLEGFVLGELKLKKLKEEKIDYRHDKYSGTAVVEAFAQREMVDSFMAGMEPQMKETIFSIIDRVLSEYPSQLQKYINMDLDRKQVNQIKKLGMDLYHSIKDTLVDYQNTHYYQPLLGIVRSLPKDELANMAESLMNLTSFKRKVTRATESVGPPIDVAVISKGDGFVWVKKKSYFDRELNN